MTLAVVIWEDRHRDVSAHLFTDRAQAEEWARARAREHTPVCGEYEETIYRDDGQDILSITYCVEGDCLRVEECDIDAELAADRSRR